MPAEHRRRMVLAPGGFGAPMIDIRKLKELVRLMVTSDLTELDVRDEHEQVTIKRASPQAAPMVMAPVQTPAMQQVFAAPQPAAVAAAAAGTAPAPSAVAPPAAAPVADGTIPIESPMVGTFYPAPGPGKPPFVQVGSKVGPDTIVCLIEAMKIFNEIKAECSGTIEAVLAKNGQAVEFGQPLFRIRKD